MAKLKAQEITASDLIEFVESQSDFAFELQILRRLTSHGFECEHGATYEDHLTGKLRQFDLRALRLFGFARIRLALECKQVRPNYPLVVLRTPRRREESFHEVLVSVDPRRCSLARDPGWTVPALEPNARNVPITGRFSRYPHSELVGKSCAQVGRDATGLASTDADMFARWSQAISSARELVTRACSDGRADSEGWAATLIVPGVVIPDGRLWVIDHDAAGNRIRDPQQVSRCSYYLDARCDAQDKVGGTEYTLSHLEFLTESGLDELVEELEYEPHREIVFPYGTLAKYLTLVKA